jgi:hypothetical protein
MVETHMPPNKVSRHAKVATGVRATLIPLLLAVAVAGLLDCEQRFSSNPPLAPDNLAPQSSSGGLDALLSPIVADAGSIRREPFHALIVTLCSSSSEPCSASPSGDVSASAGYRVTFGSGPGAVRSRGQAMADLYKELKDRTTAGEQLDAEPHARGDAGATRSLGEGSTDSKSAGGSEPLTRCAQRLLDLVDSVGEVTVDVVHGAGADECQVSMGRLTTDGGGWPCLVEAPEHPRRPGGGRKGIAF